MLVFDTAILIDALHGREAALRKIVELEETGETICTTEINALELYKGAYLSPRPKESLLKSRSCWMHSWCSG